MWNLWGSDEMERLCPLAVVPSEDALQETSVKWRPIHDRNLETPISQTKSFTNALGA